MIENSTTTTSVNPACPATNENATGATAATRIVTGSSTHSSTGSRPRPSSTAALIATPSVVPSTARTAVTPVPSALERSTDSEPSTTQNACCTSSAVDSPTAIDSPAAPRIAERRIAERRSSCWRVSSLAATDQRRRSAGRQSAPRTCSTCSATVCAANPSARAANDGSCALVTGTAVPSSPIRSSVALAARLPGRHQRPQPGPDRLVRVRR